MGCVFFYIMPNLSPRLLPHKLTLNQWIRIDSQLHRDYKLYRIPIPRDQDQVTKFYRSRCFQTIFYLNLGKTTTIPFKVPQSDLDLIYEDTSLSRRNQRATSIKKSTILYRYCDQTKDFKTISVEFVLGDLICYYQIENQTKTGNPKIIFKDDDSLFKKKPEVTIIQQSKFYTKLKINDIDQANEKFKEYTS